MSRVRAALVQSLGRVPRGVWVLGAVSFCMDVSSEMIHALLPLFMVGVLGASATVVGTLEGLAEATASLSKIYSGRLSDRLGRRKALTIAGYALSAATKPLFAWAPSVAWVFGARLTDRIGKGVRGAPRDALLAELAPPESRGASYGLRQALDTAGAVAGPALALGLMAASGGAFRLVFALAAIPAVAAVWLLAAGVREPRPARDKPASDAASAHGSLGRAYWTLVGVAGLFTLARFSEAFLVLKAAEDGLAASLAPLVFIVMNISYALSAYPAGHAADRLDRWQLFWVGCAFLGAADLLLATSNTVSLALVGTALWGLSLGFTQGLFAAMVADAAPAERRGTAFGAFYFVTGLVLLAASGIAGALWDLYGSRTTFATGAVLTLVAAATAWWLRRLGWLDGTARP